MQEHSGRQRRGRDHAVRIMLGLFGIGMAIGAYFPISEGTGTAARALGLSGYPGTFVVESCQPSRDRNGRQPALCDGIFIPADERHASITLSRQGGPHAPGTRIAVSGNSDAINAVGLGTAFSGLALATIFGGFGVFMASGCLLVLMGLLPDRVTSRAARALIYVGCGLVAVGLAFVILAICLP
ncbi:hypothetical protein ACFWF7_34810 [Nocardia sp. NPDC060256]|uniref:hypothetical protein n=1 Tax=unclassified Nocardia TaxID=2637762 RepID=UPI003662F09B